MSDELLPCPFCGGEPEIHWINEAGEVLTAWVKCKCGCEHHERLTKEVAVKKWNSRHLTNDAQASRDRHTAIETAIRSYCRRQSSAAVQNGRIYYAGLSITDLVNDIEAALTTSGGDVAAGAPEPVDITGWKLVPDDPTEAMWQAGRSADINLGDSYSKVWRAMFDAAPDVEDCETTSSVSSAGNAAQAAPSRNNVIEECAKILDSAAQDWHRIRDPGMANNAKSYAKRIRALAAPSVEQGTK